MTAGSPTWIFPSMCGAGGSGRQLHIRCIRNRRKVQSGQPSVQVKRRETRLPRRIVLIYMEAFWICEWQSRQGGGSRSNKQLDSIDITGHPRQKLFAQGPFSVAVGVVLVFGCVCRMVGRVVWCVVRVHFSWLVGGTKLKCAYRDFLYTVVIHEEWKTCPAVTVRQSPRQLPQLAQLPTLPPLPPFPSTASLMKYPAIAEGFLCEEIYDEDDEEDDPDFPSDMSISDDSFNDYDEATSTATSYKTTTQTSEFGISKWSACQNFPFPACKRAWRRDVSDDENGGWHDWR